MDLRRWSSLQGLAALGAALLPASATLMLGCGGGGMVGNGASDAGVDPASLIPANLLADFEDASAAKMAEVGSPVRKGYWFAYDDMSPSCEQTPAIGAPYLPAVPPTPSPKSGGLALHGQWTSCDEFGGIVGGDFDQTAGNQGDHLAPNVPYDLSNYTGVTFWAMSTPGSVNKLRVKVTTTDESTVAEGGTCVETATGPKCEDSYGYAFSLPTDGSWAQFTFRFSDSRFKQLGFGAQFKWNPAHALSLQVQSQSPDLDRYDFWLDDFYLIQ